MFPPSYFPQKVAPQGLEGPPISVYSVFMTLSTTFRSAFFAALLALATFAAVAAPEYDLMRPAIPLINEKRKPPRPPHGIQSIDSEALMHSYYTRGKPAGWLVQNAQGRIAQRIAGTTLEGVLKKSNGPGLYEIAYRDVLLANVDWTDRGDMTQAERLMDQLLGTKVSAKCHVALANGPLVCEVKGEIDGKLQDIGGHILSKGWLGWQSEVGYVSTSAHAMARGAYWEGRGVWSNPWYFPDGRTRNAYPSFQPTRK